MLPRKLASNTNGHTVALQVLAGVSIAGILAALPFLSSTVREREQAVANMRDAAIDAKDEARNSRLRTSSK